MPAQDLARCRQVACEFHDTSKLGDLESFALYKAAIATILENFFPAHLHANNFAGFAIVAGVPIPKVFEVTFVNRKFYSPSSRQHVGPMAVDAPNNENAPDLFLGSPFLLASHSTLVTSAGVFIGNARHRVALVPSRCSRLVASRSRRAGTRQARAAWPGIARTGPVQRSQTAPTASSARQRAMTACSASRFEGRTRSSAPLIGRHEFHHVRQCVVSMQSFWSRRSRPNSWDRGPEQCDCKRSGQKPYEEPAGRSVSLNIGAGNSAVARSGRPGQGQMRAS